MTGPGGRLPLIACAVLILLGLAFRLDGYPLLDPDEGRNAEIAREMATSNDYLLPRLDGLPYVDKPVLYFAVDALVMKVLGPTTLAARLPSLLFTLGTLALVWWFGRRLFGDEAGAVAAIATAASPLTIAFARTVIFDSALTFFIVVALVGFYLGAEETVRRTAVWWPTLAWGAVALGVLTKGPIALGILLMVIIPYAAWRRAWKVLLDPVGLLLFLAIVLPWVRFMSVRVPGYLHYVFFTETFLRFATPALQRTEPWWYFVPILVLGALPWSIMIGRRDGGTAGRRVGGGADGRVVFLFLWILVPLVFFSLSQSKRPQYVLPLVPAVGLLVAGTWNEKGVKVGSLALGVLGMLLLVGYPWFPSIIKNLTPAIASAIPRTALPLATTCICCAAASWWFRASRAAALTVLVLPVTALPVIGGPLMREIGKERSAAELASNIERALTDRTEVVAVHTFPLSLPFYLQRTVTLATETGSELTSNYLVGDLKLWTDVPGSPLRPGDWWREAAVDCMRPRVFVIRSWDTEARAFLGSRMTQIAETGKYAAFGPCGVPTLASEAR